MQAFLHKHYVGSLRTKQGEFDAVRALPAGSRTNFTPLWEVQPLDDTPTGQIDTMPLDPILDTLPARIHKASLGLEGFADCHLLARARRRADGEHPLRWLCKATAAEGTILTPIVRIDSDSAYIAAAQSAIAETTCDLAIRLVLTATVSLSAITALLRACDMVADATHLILDLEYIDISARTLPVGLPSTINAILAIGAWKTVTLLSGGIPKDYSRFKVGLTTIDRIEWPIWLGLVSAGVLTHRPAFGDYGLSHAKYSYLPVWARGKAKIRYTARSTYLFYLGRSLKSRFGGHAQYYALAAMAIAHSAFRGASYSAGDKRIDDCARRLSTSGNPKTWVYASTNLHIVWICQLVRKVT